MAVGSHSLLVVVAEQIQEQQELADIAELAAAAADTAAVVPGMPVEQEHRKELLAVERGTVAAVVASVAETTDKMRVANSQLGALVPLGTLHWGSRRERVRRCPYLPTNRP